MSRKAELKAEDTVVSSPLRRSSRIIIVNSPAPAPLETSKPIRTRRASASQESKETESKPVKGRRVSVSKEEPDEKVELNKTRTRGSSAPAESVTKEEPKKTPITKRRRSSAAEENSEQETVRPSRGRRNSATEKTPTEENILKPVRGRRNSTQAEKDEDETKDTSKKPLRDRKSEEIEEKKSVRSRRLSADNQEENIETDKEKKTTKRSLPTDKLDEPDVKISKSTTAKPKRRLSVTENAVILESIAEQESETTVDRKSASPDIKSFQATESESTGKADVQGQKSEVNKKEITPVKKKHDHNKTDFDLSIICEGSFSEGDESKTQEKLLTPRKSPRLHKETEENVELAKVKSSPQKLSTQRRARVELESRLEGKEYTSIKSPHLREEDKSSKVESPKHLSDSQENKKSPSEINVTKNSTELDLKDVGVDTGKINSLQKSPTETEPTPTKLQGFDEKNLLSEETREQKISTPRKSPKESGDIKAPVMKSPEFEDSVFQTDKLEAKENEGKPLVTHISTGSEDSFRVHMNMSALSKSSQENIEDEADFLNVSKGSNSSDKENSVKNCNELESSKENLKCDETVQENNLKEIITTRKSVCSRISNVFRPKQIDYSFTEPMDVDERSILNNTRHKSTLDFDETNIETVAEEINSHAGDSVDKSFKLNLSVTSIESAVPSMDNCQNQGETNEKIAKNDGNVEYLLNDRKKSVLNKDVAQVPDGKVADNKTESNFESAGVDTTSIIESKPPEIIITDNNSEDADEQLEVKELPLVTKEVVQDQAKTDGLGEEADANKSLNIDSTVINNTSIIIDSKLSAESNVQDADEQPVVKGLTVASKEVVHNQTKNISKHSEDELTDALPEETCEDKDNFDSSIINNTSIDIDSKKSENKIANIVEDPNEQLGVKESIVLTEDVIKESALSTNDIAEDKSNICENLEERFHHDLFSKEMDESKSESNFDTTVLCTTKIITESKTSAIVFEKHVNLQLMIKSSTSENNDLQGVKPTVLCKLDIKSNDVEDAPQCSPQENINSENTSIPQENSESSPKKILIESENPKLTLLSAALEVNKTDDKSTISDSPNSSEVIDLEKTQKINTSSECKQSFEAGNEMLENSENIEESDKDISTDYDFELPSDEEGINSTHQMVVDEKTPDLGTAQAEDGLVSASFTLENDQKIQCEEESKQFNDTNRDTSEEVSPKREDISFKKSNDESIHNQSEQFIVGDNHTEEGPLETPDTESEKQKKELGLLNTSMGNEKDNNIQKDTVEEKPHEIIIDVATTEAKSDVIDMTPSITVGENEATNSQDKLSMRTETIEVTKSLLEFIHPENESVAEPKSNRKSESKFELEDRIKSSIQESDDVNNSQNMKAKLDISDGVSQSPSLNELEELPSSNCDNADVNGEAITIGGGKAKSELVILIEDSISESGLPNVSKYLGTETSIGKRKTEKKSKHKNASENTLVDNESGVIKDLPEMSKKKKSDIHSGDSRTETREKFESIPKNIKGNKKVEPSSDESKILFGLDGIPCERPIVDIEQKTITDYFKISGKTASKNQKDEESRLGTEEYSAEITSGHDQGTVTSVKDDLPKKKLSLEEFANSKLDEYLSKRISEMTEDEETSENDDDDDDNDSEQNEFIDGMAEEGEEDTPSEDSNAIIDEGESINSTESELETDEDYDENDSFICQDDEVIELLSGDEYDLDDEKKTKNKKSRIIDLQNIEADVISFKKKKRDTKKVPKKRSRIISVSSSSSVDEYEKEEVVSEESVICEAKVLPCISSGQSGLTSPEKMSVENEKEDKSVEKKKAITIHENINVREIEDAVLSERIHLLVDNFSLNCPSKDSLEESAIKETEPAHITSIKRRKRKNRKVLAVETPTKVGNEHYEAKKATSTKIRSPKRSRVLEEEEASPIKQKKTKKHHNESHSKETMEYSLESEGSSKSKKGSVIKGLSKKKTIKSLPTEAPSKEEIEYLGESSGASKSNKSKSGKRVKVVVGHISPRKQRLSSSMIDVGGSTTSEDKHKKRKQTQSLENVSSRSHRIKKGKKSNKKLNVNLLKEVNLRDIEIRQSADHLRSKTFGIMNQLITDVKNRPIRTVMPSRTKDADSSWIIEVADVKPSTTILSKREIEAYRSNKIHPKDFRNQMLYNSSRVKRVETKALLKKKGAYF